MYQATKMFNWTEAEAKEKLFDGDELKEDYADIILEADKARVEKFKTDRTDSYNKGVKETEKKLKTFAEDEFKEVTGYTGTEPTFKEKFIAWQETEKKKWQKNIEINEDQVKKHPAYIALESERVPKTEYDKIKSEYDDYKTSEERNRIMGMVTISAWDLVAAKSPIIEKNETVAANRRRDFLSKLSAYDYELQSNGDPIVIKDGKRLENEHGNLITFKTFVSDLSDLYFEFRAQDEVGNAGNKPPAGSDVIVITDKPTTAAEYNAAIAKWNGGSDEHAKQRIAIAKYYKEHKKD